MKISHHIACSIVFVTTALMKLWSAIPVKQILTASGLALLYSAAMSWLVGVFYEGLLCYYLPLSAHLSHPTRFMVVLSGSVLAMLAAVRISWFGNSLVERYSSFCWRSAGLAFFSLVVTMWVARHDDYDSAIHLAAMLTFVCPSLLAGSYFLVKWAWATTPECAQRS